MYRTTSTRVCGAAQAICTERFAAGDEAHDRRGDLGHDLQALLDRWVASESRLAFAKPGSTRGRHEAKMAAGADKSRRGMRPDAGSTPRLGDPEPTPDVGLGVVVQVFIQARLSALRSWTERWAPRRSFNGLDLEDELRVLDQRRAVSPAAQTTPRGSIRGTNCGQPGATRRNSSRSRMPNVVGYAWIVPAGGAVAGSNPVSSIGTRGSPGAFGSSTV